MPIYAVDEHEPVIHPDAFVHPDAVVIGRVTIGARSSVWPSAVLRGDHGAIRVGTGTSIQDGSVVHATATLDTVVGDDVVVGHLAHLEGCVVESGSLVGSKSVVLHRARIGTRAMVAAGAVVTNGVQVPPGALAVGVPAVIKEGRAQVAIIEASARMYVNDVDTYRRSLRRIE